MMTTFGAPSGALTSKRGGGVALRASISVIQRTLGLRDRQDRAVEGIGGGGGKGQQGERAED